MRSFLRCAVTIFCLSPSLSRASLVQVFSPTSLSTSDTTLVYPTYPSIQNLYSPYQISAGAETLTFQAQGFQIYRVGTNYSNTGFSNGTNILYTHAGSGGVSAPDSSMSFSLSAPVTQLSFNLEQYAPGNETFLIDVITSAGSTSFSVAGNDPSSLAFFGVQATGSTTINGIDIQDVVDTDIAIGPITFGSPTNNPLPGA